MIPSGTAPTACFMAGTTPALAPATSAHRPIGCSAIPTRACSIGSDALALAERIAHPFSLEPALLFNAMLHLDRGEPELALQRLDAAEALVAEQRLGLHVEPRFLRGAALSAQGAFEEAVACLREGLAGGSARRVSPLRPCPLAEALARQGEHGAALAAAREGWRRRKKRVTASGRRNFIASKASHSSVSTELEEGQTAFEEALRVARTAAGQGL